MREKRIVMLRWAAAVMLLAAVCHAADAIDETDTWNDGLVGDWDCMYCDAVVTNESDYLVAQFDSQTVPDYERCIAWTP